MTKEQISTLKTKLLKLADDYSGPINTEELKVERLADESDAAMQGVNQSLATRLASRRSLYLRKVKQAIESIENGTYGLCEDCDEPISYKRMLARPTATLCVECKGSRERNESIREAGGQLMDWEPEPTKKI